MSVPSPDLDSFPDSPYAAQLRRGFGRLRFPPALEAEFAGFHLIQVIRRVRVWHLIILLMMVAIGARRAASQDWPYSAGVMLRLGIVVPCAALLLWAAWTSAWERWYPRALVWVTPVIYCTAMFLTASSVGERGSAVVVVPTVALLAASMLVGARFHQSVALGGIILASFLAGAVYFGATQAELGYTFGLLLVVWFVGAILAFSMEEAQRMAFLQNGLLREMVSRDALTGLGSRRLFDQHLHTAWRQALRDHRPLGILMIDVDHFKKYNDRYGHQAGDNTLKAVADVIRTVSRRPLDLAARYGGEEFAVILYDLDDAGVREMADRIRNGVEALGLEHRDSPVGRVTVSLGVALVRPSRQRSPEGAVQLADEALYAAKAEGRNRIKVLVHEQSALRTGHFRLREAALATARPPKTSPEITAPGAH